MAETYSKKLKKFSGFLTKHGFTFEIVKEENYDFMNVGLLKNEGVVSHAVREKIIRMIGSLEEARQADGMVPYGWALFDSDIKYGSKRLFSTIR